MSMIADTAAEQVEERDWTIFAIILVVAAVVASLAIVFFFLPSEYRWLIGYALAGMAVGAVPLVIHEAIGRPEIALVCLGGSVTTFLRWADVGDRIAGIMAGCLFGAAAILAALHLSKSRGRTWRTGPGRLPSTYERP